MFGFRHARVHCRLWITFTTLTAPPDGAVDDLDPAPLDSSAYFRIAAP